MKTRAHVAKRLESRFHPLFLLERSKIPWPVKTAATRAALSRISKDLGEAFDEAFAVSTLSRHGDRWGIDVDTVDRSSSPPTARKRQERRDGKLP